MLRAADGKAYTPPDAYHRLTPRHTTYDFFNTEFSANSTGIDAVLDAIDVDLKPALRRALRLPLEACEVLDSSLRKRNDLGPAEKALESGTKSHEAMAGSAAAISRIVFGASKFGSRTASISWMMPSRP